jgi:hypothetical protein
MNINRTTGGIMFTKFVTTVHPNGTVTVDHNRDAVAAEDVEADMARERKRISQIAREYGRIETVEQTMTTLVIIYVAGTVRVYHWVAEGE